MWVVLSNIVIGLYLLDMWSVLFVTYVGGMFRYSDWTECNWICSQCFVFHVWRWGSNIAIGLYILNIWSVLCVGLHVLDMWSVLCVP